MTKEDKFKQLENELIDQFAEKEGSDIIININLRLSKDHNQYDSIRDIVEKVRSGAELIEGVNFDAIIFAQVDMKDAIEKAKRKAIQEIEEVYSHITF